MFATPVWDLELFKTVNGSPNAVLDVVMPALSASWWQWALGVAILFWLLWRRRPEQGTCANAPSGIRCGGWKALLLAGLLVAVAAGLADLATNGLKKHYGRVRPLDAVAGARYQDHGWQVRPPDFVAQKERGNSFPSAHAANTMVVGLAIMALWPPMRPWFLAFPLAVGLSRIYLGKHYPSDVLAGWLLGLTIALVLLPVLLRVRRLLQAPELR